MPTLTWIGKQAVEKHHLEIPYRLLEYDESLSVGDIESGNLIVQGDNLHALKALLPYYAGKVKYICIDPPYNTGNEKWKYNDNVNSPEIKEWFNKVVKGEDDDLSRHDKWLCMMYPRLKILKKMLHRDGLICVSIDENELSYAIFLLDEIFSKKNMLACAPWLAEPSGGKEKNALRNGHEYILIYHNGNSSVVTKEERSVGKLNLKDKFGPYRKGRELRKWGGTSLRQDRPGQWYELATPTGEKVLPYRNDGKEGHWRWGKEQKMKNIISDPDVAHWEKCPYDHGIVVNGATERWVPFEKIRDSKKAVGWATWLDNVGYNSDGTNTLKQIFGEKVFDTPKPVSLLKWLISLHDDENLLVLDSFAGSATTAHALLELNYEDGGNRNFILIEMDEEIAKNATAERMKRVINGYTIQKINGITEQVEGLGGGFRYCNLGEPLFDKYGNVRQGVKFKELARHIFFSENGVPLSEKAKLNTPLIGIYKGAAYYLLFNGILGDKTVNGGNVLTSRILESLPKHNGPKIIFGESNRLSAARLKKENIMFKQIPYEIKTS
ncbi:MAG: site-specific DNA-methyltransferase [Melioribacteraceae bacterium]